MFNNVYFAQELKEIRERKGISLREVADSLQTSRSQVHRIECGQNITVNTLAEYLDVIGLDINDVFRE